MSRARPAHAHREEAQCRTASCSLAGRSGSALETRVMENTMDTSVADNWRQAGLGDSQAQALTSRIAPWSRIATKADLEIQMSKLQRFSHSLDGRDFPCLFDDHGQYNFRFALMVGKRCRIAFAQDDQTDISRSFLSCLVCKLPQSRAPAANPIRPDRWILDSCAQTMSA